VSAIPDGVRIECYDGEVVVYEGDWVVAGIGDGLDIGRAYAHGAMMWVAWHSCVSTPLVGGDDVHVWDRRDRDLAWRFFERLRAGEVQK
jgi:hypothetical protein